jgi:hypothetical protein
MPSVVRTVDAVQHLSRRSVADETKPRLASIGSLTHRRPVGDGAKHVAIGDGEQPATVSRLPHTDAPPRHGLSNSENSRMMTRCDNAFSTNTFQRITTNG